MVSSIEIDDKRQVPYSAPLHNFTQQGKDVHIIVDGVSSQQPLDREVALQRLSQAGAFLTTAQSAAFMLMQSTYALCFACPCLVLCH